MNLLSGLPKFDFGFSEAFQEKMREKREKTLSMVSNIAKAAHERLRSNERYKRNRKGYSGGVVNHVTQFDQLVLDTVRYNKKWNAKHPHDKRPTRKHKVRKKLRRSLGAKAYMS